MIGIINPQTTQELILAWIGVATVLVGSFSGLVALVITKIVQIKSEAALKQGESDHATSTANIAALQGAVTTIALKTVPEKTSSSEPEKVTVVNTAENPAITKETKQ